MCGVVWYFNVYEPVDSVRMCTKHKYFYWHGMPNRKLVHFFYFLKEFIFWVLAKLAKDLRFNPLTTSGTLVSPFTEISILF